MKKDVDLKQKKFWFCSMLFALFDKKFRQKKPYPLISASTVREKRTCISIGSGTSGKWVHYFFMVQKMSFHAAELAVTFVTTSSQRNTGDCFHQNV
jgi:hypothetical protein